MSISPRNYTACNSIDLRIYYNTGSHPVSCEFCKEKQKNVHLHEYLLADGQTHWYVCSSCGFAGTGVDYLSKLNGIEAGQQIQELVKSKHLPATEDRNIQKYKQFKEDWSTLKNQFAAATPFRRHMTPAFANMYNLDYCPIAQSFRQGTKQDFEAWFRPSLKEKAYCTSSSRLFKGAWSHITAIPLYDLPLHFSAVLFVNGHETGEQPYVIRRLGPYANGQYFFDPGFLGPRTVCRPDLPSIILCSQWQLALSLQAAFFRQNNKYPPLLGWFPVNMRTGTPYAYAWSGLKNITKVFWSTPNDLPSLREACVQKGLVSFAHFNDRGQFTYSEKLYNRLPQSIIKNADPWHKALTWYLEGHVDNLRDRLAALQLPNEILEEYLQYAPAAVRSKITEKGAPITADQGKYVDGSKVISDSDGWWKQGKGMNRSLLSNVRCVLEKVVHIADDQPVYQGKVFIGTNEYAFTEKESIFEKCPIAVVEKVCVENSCPQFLRINIGSEQYLRLVKEVSMPETIYQREGYGWSKKESALSLPNIAISDTTVFDTTMQLQTGPFHRLTAQFDQPITPVIRTTLANFPEETPVIFSIFSAIIPPLFSPAYRMHPPQTVVSGGEFMLVKQICEMLGLPTMSLKDREEIEKYISVHDCPFLVRIQPLQKSKKSIHAWVDVLGLNTPALVWTSVTEALSRMSYGRANLLLLPNTRFYKWFDGKLPNSYLVCFVKCLQHLSRYVLDPVVHTDDWNNDLLKETFRFFEEEVGVAPAKNALFGGYYDQADFFYDYVGLLRRSEQIVLDEKNLLSIAELADCYRRHIGIFEFQRLYEGLQQNEAIKEYDAKKQTLMLDTERFAISGRRLEKFYGSLLRS